MKPLRETEGGSPLLERAKTLLDAAEPLPESRERMLRVRRALDQRRGLWVSLGRLPAAAMAALIVLFGASAFAAVRVFEAVRSELLDSPASPLDAAPKRAKPVRSRAKPAQSAQAEPLAPMEAPSPTPADHAEAATSTSTPTQAEEGSAPATSSTRATPRASGTTKGHRVHHAGSATARGEPETSPEALARVTDSELVHRAAKALRSEHDPALAARLLEAHRARSPSGPLAEEALSLQIEALSALGSPRAASHAREYLARYPGGRYTAVAKGALSDPAP